MPRPPVEKATQVTFLDIVWRSKAKASARDYATSLNKERFEGQHLACVLALFNLLL